MWKTSAQEDNCDWKLAFQREVTLLVNAPCSPAIGIQRTTNLICIGRSQNIRTVPPLAMAFESI